MSAEVLSHKLEKRRNQLRTTLPIGRVVGPADVAALAVHIMTNTALTGATYDIDGGEQFVVAKIERAESPTLCRVAFGIMLTICVPCVGHRTHPRMQPRS
jgi:hypothetical protein